MDIVYKVGTDGYEGALFARRDDAERVAQIRTALNTAKTWGEFRASLPDGEWEENLEGCFDGDIPPDEKPFDAEAVPGHLDGDYPEWLRQTELEWFPEELMGQYGRRETSVFNGDMLDIPAEHAEVVAAKLRAMGYTVEKTDLDIF